VKVRVFQHINRSLELVAQSKKVLITGGFGFVAAHLAHVLVKNGFEVTLFDNSDWSNSSAFALGLEEQALVKRVLGSVTQPRDLELLSNDFSYIVHAAGVLGIKRVAEQQLLTMDVNILGTRHVLDLAYRQTALRRFIQFSTSETYGQFASSPDEDQPSVIPARGHRWCYATSKVAGEYLVKAFIAERGLPAVIVRPFNVYGPYRYGSNALTTLVQNAIAGTRLTISGSGEQTRSWCHIQDFVRGVLATLQIDGISGEVFNIGNDKNNISMLKLAQLICEMIGSPSEIYVDNIESDDVHFRQPNIDKARKLLNYEPEIDLPAGINDLFKWLRQEPTSFSPSSMVQ
jgi:nucleoside-diphosphate-sugar epimerase